MVVADARTSRRPYHFDSVDQLQTCVDWGAFDKALVWLYRHNNKLSVALAFRIRSLQPLGPSLVLEEVVARLVSMLTDALQAGIPISVALSDGTSSERTVNVTRLSSAT